MIAVVLTEAGYEVTVDMNQPGYIRALVHKGDSTKIEWAHDSAWRFLPTVQSEEFGYRLHPIDLAVNKALALAGRDEARDFLDILHIHDNVLSLGAVCWAAAGKDPGFTPLSLLELLRRRGKYQPEDFSRLHLVAPVRSARPQVRLACGPRRRRSIHQITAGAGDRLPVLFAHAATVH